uniref:Glycosyl transferase, group 1 n=1 Tax=Rhodopseudomonas palustris (strain BisA53) TaxID=316055 RepID=Q07IS6_RHOP5
MTRKLLHVCNDLAYWTAHRRAVAQHAQDAGWDVTIATAPHPSADDLPKQGFRHLALPIDRFRLRPRDDLRLLAALLPLMSNARFEAVHLFTMKPLLLGGLAARLADLIYMHQTARLIATVAGIGRGFSGGARGWKSAALQRGLALGLGRTAAALTFENTGDRDFYVGSGMIDEARTDVFPGAGIDLRLFAPSTARAADIVTVLFAGRLLRSKGVMDLVGAAGILEQRFGNRVRILIAGPHTDGDPDGLDERERQALQRGHLVSYLGAVPLDEMPALMASADIFVLPTRYPEGLPRVLLEAAATGAALIAGDVDGTRAFVTHGVNGLLLPRTDEAAIADAIGELVTAPDLRRRLGQAAREKVTQGGYDIRDIATRFLQLYEKPPGNAASR